MDPGPKALAGTRQAKAFSAQPAEGTGDPLSGATSANRWGPTAGRRQFGELSVQIRSVAGRLPSSLSDLSGPRHVVKAPPASFPPSCGERTQPSSERATLCTPSLCTPRPGGAGGGATPATRSVHAWALRASAPSSRLRPSHCQVWVAAGSRQSEGATAGSPWIPVTPSTVHAWLWPSGCHLKERGDSARNISKDR